METGKRGFNLLITLLLVASWMGCSSDKQLTGPPGSAQVSLNIQFAPSVAKQSFGYKIDNATQIIQEVTVSVLEAGSNAAVIKEQQLEINSTPQGRFAEGELSIPVREDGLSFNIVVFAGDPDNLLFFTGTANVTLESGETRDQPVNIFLQPATSIASGGTVNASSTFPQQGFGPTSAIDLNFGTSWFSGGPSVDGNSSTFTWTARQQEFLGTIGIFNNERHNNPAFQTGFGFRTVTFQVYDGPDGSGIMLYEETVDYPQTFPVVRVSPFVSGRSIRLRLNEHEDPSCGGFSELLVVTLDLSAGETPLSAPTISNIQSSLVEINSTTCGFQDPPGSLFEFTLDYTDPDGDVTDSTKINYSFTFSPSDTSGSSTFPPVLIAGGGGNGTITFNLCVVFGSDTSLDQSISITDASGEMSNALPITIDKPSGGNSPPGGNTSRRGFEKIAFPDKRF